MTLIATTFREKLPQGWSYPLGAEFLSKLFADVPQFNAFQLYFMRRPTIFASEHQAAIRANAPVDVLTIHFRNHRLGRSGSDYGLEHGWYGEQWTINVCAVPSPSRAAVRDAITRMQNELCTWLREPRSETWREREHHCRIRVHLDDVQPWLEHE